MNLAGLPIGPGEPCRVVAELSNAHNGALDRALRIIDAVKHAGADYLKTQCYTPDELVTLRGDGPAPEPWGSDGWSMRDLYEKAQTPHDWFPLLTAHCREIGLPWFSSVFGPQSLALLESLDCPAYKVAAFDTKDAALYAGITNTGKQTIVSFRDLPSQTEIDPTWTDVQLAWLSVADVALYCPAGYPQTHHDMAKLGAFHGLSYHGTDPNVPIMAAIKGASIIEVHVQLDDEPSELEADVSLTISQVTDMVTELRSIGR